MGKTHENLLKLENPGAGPQPVQTSWELERQRLCPCPGTGIGQQPALRVPDRQTAPNSGLETRIPHGEGDVVCQPWAGDMGLFPVRAVVPEVPSPSLLLPRGCCGQGPPVLLLLGGHYPVLNGVWCDCGAGEQPPQEPLPGVPPWGKEVPPGPGPPTLPQSFCPAAGGLCCGC